MQCTQRAAIRITQGDNLVIPVALCSSTDITDIDTFSAQVRYTRDLPPPVTASDDEEAPSPVATKNQIVTVPLEVMLHKDTRQVYVTFPTEITSQMRVGDGSWAVVFDWRDNNKHRTVLRGEIQVESEIGERDDMA